MDTFNIRELVGVSEERSDEIAKIFHKFLHSEEKVYGVYVKALAEAKPKKIQDAIWFGYCFGRIAGLNQEKGSSSEDLQKLEVLEKLKALAKLLE